MCWEFILNELIAFFLEFVELKNILNSMKTMVFAIAGAQFA